MSAIDLFTDLLQPMGEIRPNSPRVRPAQSGADSGVSPNSPFSPIGKLARSIANEHAITPEQALELLDDDDKAMIQAGDQPTIDAWRCAVASRIRRGIWTALTGNDALDIIAPAKVTCASCRHARPTTHPALVQCDAGQMAPGASGLWWGTDRHECTDFAAAKP